ncbi:MAG: ABC transporter permease [Negativicutes bacterium]|jgi:lipopolysaccharide transport system permease protein
MTNNWTSVIDSKNKLMDLKLRDLWQYRDLIAMLVRRDFVAVYKQTVLGPLWHIFQPLFTTIVFTVVFGQIAKLPTNGMPQVLFYMTGTVMWGYFAPCLTQTSNTFVANAGIFGKVYFPRLVIPVATVLTQLIAFAIQFCMLVCFWLYFYFSDSQISLNVWALALPLLIIQMALLGLGCGIIVSSLTTKYRDLSLLVTFGVQLWMYATPVVYPLSLVPTDYQWLLLINPMTAIIEIFRHGMLGGVLQMPLQFWLYSWLETLLLLFFGLIMFNRVEKNFMDTV